MPSARRSSRSPASRSTRSGAGGLQRQKGSVPVRPDVDASKDPCGQEGVAILRDKTHLVGNPEMYLSPDQNGAMVDVLTNYWNRNIPVEGAEGSAERAGQALRLARMKRGGLTAWAALLPLAVVVRGLPGLGALDAAHLAVQFARTAARRLRRAGAVRAALRERTLAAGGAEHRALRRAFIGTVVVLGFCSRSSSTRRCAARACCARLFSTLCDELRRHRPGLAVGAQPRKRAAGRLQALGWQDFQFDWIVDPTWSMYRGLRRRVAGARAS